MHIIWHGQSCFQIIVSYNKGEQATILIDPFDASVGLKTPSLSADILLISHFHSDHNNKKAVRNTPFLIEGPGEYETKEIFIQGIASFHDDQEGKLKGLNTIYSIEAEGLKVCHLGDLGQKELTTEQLDEIGDVDILMIDLGDKSNLNIKKAREVVESMEPRILIPMGEGDIKEALKELGSNGVEAIEKYEIKSRSELPEDKRLYVLLKKV